MTILNLSTYNELKESVGADFIAELGAAFLEDAARQMGEMRAALAANDPDAFRRAAHSVKSNALTFGAEELAALARELELMGREKNLETGNRIEVLNEAFELVRARLNELR